MGGSIVATPFRWNIARREQLGSLISGVSPPQRLNDMFLESLRATAARILAHANRSDLAFIGRTPENLYDYLSGCFEGLRDTMPVLGATPDRLAEIKPDVIVNVAGDGCGTYGVGQQR